MSLLARSERFQGFAGFSCLSIYINCYCIFLLHLGCMLPDLVFTCRFSLCLYRGSSTSAPMITRHHQRRTSPPRSSVLSTLIKGRSYRSHQGLGLYSFIHSYRSHHQIPHEETTLTQGRCLLQPFLPGSPPRSPPRFSLKKKKLN